MIISAFKKDLSIEILKDATGDDVLVNSFSIPGEKGSQEEQRNLIEIALASVFKESFRKEGTTAVFKSQTKTLLARISRYYNRAWANYWYGLTPKDIEKFEIITDFAFLCDNKGIVLIPTKEIAKHINDKNLWETRSEGELRHYHIHFQEKTGLIIWKLKKGEINLTGSYHTF